MNFGNYVRWLHAGAVCVDGATFAEHSPGGLLKWSMASQNMPSMGQLGLSRAQMYSIGTPGTVFAQPFLDQQTAGEGDGTTFAVGAVAAKAAADETVVEVTDTSKVSVDGCTREVAAAFGEDGSWIARELEAGTVPRTAAVLAAALNVYGKARADLWLAVVVAAVASLWLWAAAETFWCDIVLRGIMLCRAAKSFPLSRMHSLPPWLQPRFCKREDGRVECTLHDLREDVRAAGFPVPTDAERHKLSPWRDAAFDLEGSELGELASEEVRNIMRSWAKARSLPQNGGLGQLKKLLWETVHKGQAMPTASGSTLTGSSPGDMEAASGALRLHADLNDADMMHTHVKEVRDVQFGGAWLTVDVRPGQVVHTRSLAEKHPENVHFVLCPARAPVKGVVSTTTLARLPRRAAEVSVGNGTFTTFPAKWTPHFVGRSFVLTKEGDAAE